jgi:hypothetical protein
MIREPRRVDEICRSLSPHFDVAPEIVERDVLAFVQALADRGLVRLVDPARTEK